MPNVSYDVDRPVEVELQFDSPHVVTYWLWVRTGGAPWELLASGTDHEPASETGHRHSVGPLPPGSEIRWRAVLSGNPHTAYRLALEVRQEGRTLHQDSRSGITNGQGVAVEQDDLHLVPGRAP